MKDYRTLETAARNAQTTVATLIEFGTAGWIASSPRTAAPLSQARTNTDRNSFSTCGRSSGSPTSRLELCSQT